MIDNFVIVSTPEQAKKRYNLESVQFCLPITRPSIISGGDQAWVITSKSPDTLQSMKFGYTTEYSKNRMNMLNLRTEKVDRDDDEDEYDRLMRIFTKPEFAAALHSSRCAVLVDAFLVTSPDNKTYLIHMQNQERPFAIAGICANWLNFETSLYETGFTIITAAANPMLRRIGVEDLPVILTPQNVSKWLDLRLDRRIYLPLIHTFPDDTMNGYPVTGQIFSLPMTRDRLEPIGQKLKPDMIPRQK